MGACGVEEGFLFGDLEVGGGEELAPRDVELRVVWMLPDEDGRGGLGDVDAVEEELDAARRGEGFDGAVGAEFGGDLL